MCRHSEKALVTTGQGIQKFREFFERPVFQIFYKDVLRLESIYASRAKFVIGSLLSEFSGSEEGFRWGT